MNSDKFYQIALTLVPNVGDLAAKKLLAYCGSAENVFKESRKSLMSIPGEGLLLNLPFFHRSHLKEIAIQSLKITFYLMIERKNCFRFVKYFNF